MSWQSQLLDLLSASLLRPLALAAAALLVLRLFRVRHPASLHAVWTAVLFAMLLLPIATVYAPHWRVPVLPPEQEASLPSAPMFRVAAQLLPPIVPIPPSLPSPSRPLSLGTIVCSLYLAGLFAMLLYRLAGFIMLRRVVARSAPLHGRLRVSTGVAAPVAVGVLRPLVILPADWREWNIETRRAVLAHELAHIRRRDTLIASLARFVKSVLWFHPLAWWISRKISELAELSCDAVALETIGDPGGYSRILLAFAGGVNRAGHRVALPGLAMAPSSKGMSKRIDQVFELADGSLRKLARPGALLIFIGVPVMCLAATLGLSEATLSTLPLPPIAFPKPPELRLVAQIAPPAQATEPVVQTPPQAALDSSVTLRVFDADGAFVKDLPYSLFHVFENGVERPLTSVRAEPVPISLALVMDRSGSMRGKHSLGAGPEVPFPPDPRDQLLIISFNDTARVERDWTSGQPLIVQATSRGGSAMRDALSLALDHMQRATNQTKALLLITDGDDNTSRISQEDLIRKVRQSGVPVYCAGLLDGESQAAVQRARRVLHELSDASGGEDQYPQSASDLFHMFSFEGLRHEYRLRYSAASLPPGAARNITVFVDRPDLIVRTQQ